MEKRSRANTGDSSFLASQEATATLDPLLQSFNDPSTAPTYWSRHSSLFYIPAAGSDAIDRGLTCEQHTGVLCASLFYLERFSGILYSLLASLLFTSTNFLIKQLDVTLLDVFLVRFVFQGAISFGYILYKGYRPFTDCHGVLLFVRSLIAATGSISFYFGLALLPLPDLTTVRYTQVVWTALLAWIVFRERISWTTIVACLFTLIGVMCVAQPSFLFPRSNNGNATSDSSVFPNYHQRSVGLLMALTCAFSISAAIVLNKKLLQQNVRQSIIMFHFILTTFTMLFVIQAYNWTFSRTNDRKSHLMKNYFTREFFFATALATSQLVPMVLSQKSIKREHPSIVTVVQASDILFAITFQNLFSDTKSNGLALIGSSLVLTSIGIVGGHKLWQDRQKRTCLPASVNDEP